MFNLSEVRKDFRLLLPTFLAAFIDNLGWGIVLPVLPAILLDFNSGIFPSSFSLSNRSILLGFLIAAYPLAQFVGAPILGAISDREGRKKVLVISLFGTAIGYALFAIGLYMSNIWVLFFSRILDGFTGGNITTLYSAAADISEEKDKPRRFGIIGMGVGLGFILGPVIGGKLSDKNLFQMFHFSIPFWFVAAISLINMFLVIFMFKETLKVRIETKMDPFSGIKNILKISKMPKLKSIFAVSFLVTFGFNLFVQFFSFYLLNKFKMTQSEVGNLFAYAGLWIAVSQGVLAGIIAKKVSAIKVVPIASIFLALTITLLVFPTNYTHMLFIIPFIAVFNGLVVPNITTIISDSADKDSQGEVMGINQSLLSLTQIIPPIIDGFLYSISVDLPIISASLLIVGAWAYFHFKFNKKQKAFVIDKII